MKFFLAYVFGLFSFQLSAQYVSDTKQLFQKIDSQMITNPVKARDLIGFVKKNYTDSKVLNQCNRLLIQTYYYENNYNEALQEITQTENQQDVEGVISYQNILYSAGIKYIDFTSKFSENTLYKINKEILEASDLIVNGSPEKACQKVDNILPEVTVKNRHNFRESFIFLLVNLGENNNMLKLPEVNNIVLKILAFYPQDLAFDILNKKLSLENVSDQWLANTNVVVENTSNFRLKTLYYDFLQNYYFVKKDVSNYSLISDRRTEQIGKRNKAVIQARSQWIYLTETKTVDEYNAAKKRGFLILSVAVLLPCWKRRSN